MASFSRFFPLLALFFATALPAVAASGGGGLPDHDELPAYAEDLFEIGPIAITNSIIAVWIVAALLIVVAQIGTRNLHMVPRRVQNFVEWLVESLFGFFEGILGYKLAKKTFWFLGTVFILVLFSNWFGLVPGIGTVGWQLPEGDGVTPGNYYEPFLRGANADLNLTMAMAMTFTVMWFWWAITEIGVKNFLAHIFAPKGEFNGIVLILMGAIFLFVGLIEVLSIAIRPVALMFRLYGNVFAGESMLETMAHMGLPGFLMWLPPLPFYFLELLVGLVQALVFSLLCAVFIQLMCEHEHDDEHDDEHDHEDQVNEPLPKSSP
jgi:F-type H+-transporting ATPase subunit a